MSHPYLGSPHLLSRKSSVHPSLSRGLSRELCPARLAAGGGAAPWVSRQQGRKSRKASLCSQERLQVPLLLSPSNPRGTHHQGLPQVDQPAGLCPPQEPQPLLCLLQVQSSPITGPAPGDGIPLPAATRGDASALNLAFLGAGCLSWEAEQGTARFP